MGLGLGGGVTGPGGVTLKAFSASIQRKTFHFISYTIYDVFFYRVFFTDYNIRKMLGSLGNKSAVIPHSFR